VGGNPIYTYAISGGAAIDAAGIASGLCAGTIYTITVTDGNGCTGTTTIQLTTPNSPTITIASSTDPSCVPGCDGTATTAVVGGNPMYTYAITGGAAIDAAGIASGLCAGTIYTITVTDANGCTGTTTIQLTTPNSPTITIASSTTQVVYRVVMEQLPLQLWAEHHFILMHHRWCCNRCRRYCLGLMCRNYLYNYCNRCQWMYRNYNNTVDNSELTNDHHILKYCSYVCTGL
jgi:hypothetical protein